MSHTRDGEPEVVWAHKVKPDQMILDIGPQTIKEYSEILKLGQTLIWNGPMGYYEKSQFSHGTFALAWLFASRSRGRAYGLAGGGETLDVIAKLKVGHFIDHISTGGGAMLAMLAGDKLPGVEAVLRDK